MRRWCHHLNIHPHNAYYTNAHTHAHTTQHNTTHNTTRHNTTQNKTTREICAYLLCFREENESLWEIKDGLEKCPTKELKQMLTKNKQTEKGGRPVLLQRCAEGMLFGAMPPCPTCGVGQLVCVRGAEYKCTSYGSKFPFKIEFPFMERLILPFSKLGASACLLGPRPTSSTLNGRYLKT